jgi:glycosyltransferase involved in cell wall biosynthesis
VITTSAFSRDIIEPFLSAGVNLYGIRNPVDVDRRQPVNVGSNASLVFVGHLEVEKGPLLAAQAACISHMKLRFVGDGTLRSQIEAEYPDCDISGWLSAGEAKKQMENSRAIVVPSLWYEGAPLVVLDAAARGVPAIVADTCAARESVIDGVTGLWFRGGDAQDLSEKLRTLKDDGFAIRLGRNAYDHYWENPQTLATHADELEKCYAKIIGSPS